MQFLLSLIVLVCLISISNAQHCQSMVCREGCESYEWLCGRSSGCAWNTEDEDCNTSDAINDPDCCEGDTTTTTTAEPTTPEPTTPEPTTPEPTTPEPTTPEPTTPEPTTPEPTTPEPTTPEPTTPEPTTPEPTTPEPTTPEPTTPEPTTPEPTTPEPTTPEPTTPEPTTPEPTTPEPTTPEPTEDGSWPTPQPTLKSAMKWEMIHPNYAGSDGELLWHVYYGDYSNDERFDSFRADEKWDANEIRPIIRSENGQLFNDDATIVSGVHSTAPSSASYGMWILMLSTAVIVIFACWYKSSLVSKEEITGLLEETKVQYNL